MGEALKFLSGQPTWLAAPIILVTLFLFLWPKILEVIHDINADNRAYQSEKRRLELLKLRYEIEVIKKTNEFDNIDAQYETRPEERVPAVESTPDSAELTEVKHHLSVWRRAALGALGAFLPSCYRIVVMIPLSSGYMSFLNIGYFLGVLLLCVMGGLGASLIPKERATPAFCILVGMSVVLVLQMGFMTVQQSVPSRLEY